jgi:16S rRNA processing protein RimM
VPENRILMGVIGRPHGVRGLLRVTSYAEDLAVYGPLSDAQGRRFVVRPRGAGVAEIAEIVGGAEVKVADRTAADRLTNTRLYVERAQLPEPEPDEFYLVDLIGLTAIDAAGASLGTVSAVHDYGAGVSLEIARGNAPPLLVPFTRACVPDVDVAAGRLRVEPPAEIDSGADGPAMPRQISPPPLAGGGRGRGEQGTRDGSESDPSPQSPPARGGGGLHSTAAHLHDDTDGPRS